MPSYFLYLSLEPCPCIRRLGPHIPLDGSPPHFSAKATLVPLKRSMRFATVMAEPPALTPSSFAAALSCWGHIARSIARLISFPQRQLFHLATPTLSVLRSGRFCCREHDGQASHRGRGPRHTRQGLCCAFLGTVYHGTPAKVVFAFCPHNVRFLAGWLNLWCMVVGQIVRVSVQPRPLLRTLDISDQCPSPPVPNADCRASFLLMRSKWGCSRPCGSCRTCARTWRTLPQRSCPRTPHSATPPMRVCESMPTGDDHTRQ